VSTGETIIVLQFIGVYVVILLLHWELAERIKKLERKMGGAGAVSGAEVRGEYKSAVAFLRSQGFVVLTPEEAERIIEGLAHWSDEPWGELVPGDPELVALLTPERAEGKA
jgi:hypothetical protein